MQEVVYTVKATGRTAPGDIFEIEVHADFETYYKDKIFFHDNEIRAKIKEVAQKALDEKAGRPTEIISSELIES